MTDNKDTQRAALLEWANNSGIGIVHVFDECKHKGGLTIAFRKNVPEHVSTNMVEIAVATCSRADTFSRKEGTRLALSKFEDGYTVTLPLSTGHKDEDLADLIKYAFTDMFRDYIS